MQLDLKTTQLCLTKLTPPFDELKQTAKVMMTSYLRNHLIMKVLLILASQSVHS